MTYNPARWKAILTYGQLSMVYNTYYLNAAMRKKYYSPHLDKIFDRIVREYGVEYPRLGKVFLERRYVKGIEPAFEVFMDKYIVRKGKIIELVDLPEEHKAAEEVTQEA